MTDQPEALLIAADLELDPASYIRDMQTARLLREQHAEIERLREAVTKYGRHLDDCVGMLGGYQCTCGFNQQGVKP